MVPRDDEEGPKLGRKRSKQRDAGDKGPVRTGGGAKSPLALPTGFGTQSFNAGNASPPSSPDVDSRDERDSLDGERSSSPLTIGEMQTGFSYGQQTFGQSGPTTTRLDPVEPATTGLTQAQTGLTPYFSAGVTTAADEVRRP